MAIWSDGYTNMNGSLLARGGASGGHGGRIETSGREGVGLRTGTIDVTAPAMARAASG